MHYIHGDHLKIDTPTLRKHMGKKVQYRLKSSWIWDIRAGEIGEIIRKQVDLGNMDFIPFDKIAEMVLMESLPTEPLPSQ